METMEMGKKSNIRLIALDIDGTLINDDHEITNENHQAIQEARKKGIEVILSTGRHYRTCNDIAKSLGLSSYLVTVNGSEIWTTAGELIDRQLLDIAIIEMLVDLHKKHNTWAWMTSTNKTWSGELPETITEHEWLKFGFDTENDEIKQSLLDELTKSDLVELSNSSPTNIEVNAAGINKARAIEKVCDRLGISMSEVMAVGDSLNDIKMIEEVGLGVAMGNAQDKVKEAANWVTDNNNNNGVAKAIRHWLL